MAFNENLSNRVREALMHLEKVEEKLMFGGICYMVNEKMCVCVSKDRLLCRIDPEKMIEALNKDGVNEMIMGGRTMKGFVRVDEEAIRSKKEFDYWINSCLEYNKSSKPSKKKSKKK